MYLWYLLNVWISFIFVQLVGSDPSRGESKPYSLKFKSQTWESWQKVSYEKGNVRFKLPHAASRGNSTLTLIQCFASTFFSIFSFINIFLSVSQSKYHVTYLCVGFHRIILLKQLLNLQSFSNNYGYYETYIHSVECRLLHSVGYCCKNAGLIPGINFKMVSSFKE